MRTFILILLLSTGCQTILPATPTSTNETIYTVVAECGYGIACPWTAPEHASDTYTTTSIANAKARFIADGDKIEQTSDTPACALGGIARRLTSTWGSEMHDADVECAAPDGRTFHLLAYANTLVH